MNDIDQYNDTQVDDSNEKELKLKRRDTMIDSNGSRKNPRYHIPAIFHLSKQLYFVIYLSINVVHLIL